MPLKQDKSTHFYNTLLSESAQKFVILLYLYEHRLSFSIAKPFPFMNKITLLFVSFLFFTTSISVAQKGNTDTDSVNQMLEGWHKAAAESNFENYFNALTDDAIFIGTDATENWNKTAFKAFSKPIFDKGKGWNFKPLERHVFFSKDKKIAWFDEVLDTWMKICRGSGVLVKIGKEWKIQHYVLSATIPNDNIDEVVKIKTPIEDIQIKKLLQK